MNQYTKYIDKSKVEYAYLIGSYSRNEHNEFSDIDIICALKEGLSTFNDNKFIDGVYVSVHYDSQSDMIGNYTDPYKYVMGHVGIKDMIVIYDPDNLVTNFKEKCMKIDYLYEFSDKINDYVNKETIEWIEEVNKSVNGYIFFNPTKMIAGLHGLTYGMLSVLSVSEGIIRTKHGLLPTFKEYFIDENVYKLLENAFGVTKLDIKERIYNGLLFYKEIIKIIEYRFDDKTVFNIEFALNNIKKVIKEV